MRQVKSFGDCPGNERHQEILRRYSDEHIDRAGDKNAKVLFRESEAHRQHYEAEN